MNADLGSLSLPIRNFWVWGDSNLYLARTCTDALLLTVEHRGASAPPPISLKLAADE